MFRNLNKINDLQHALRSMKYKGRGIINCLFSASAAAYRTL
jgi:hypothetical protein